jgi:hypothetical protein
MTSSRNLWASPSVRTLAVVVDFVRTFYVFEFVNNECFVAWVLTRHALDHTHNRRARAEEPEDPYTPFLYLIPLLLMFLLASLASSIQATSSKAQFSLHRTDEFVHHHKTRINGIDYYLSSEFDTSVFIDENSTGTPR